MIYLHVWKKFWELRKTFSLFFRDCKGVKSQSMHFIYYWFNLQIYITSLCMFQVIYIITQSGAINMFHQVLIVCYAHASVICPKRDPCLIQSCNRVSQNNIPSLVAAAVHCVITGLVSRVYSCFKLLINIMNICSLSSWDHPYTTKHIKIVSCCFNLY